MIDKNVIGIIVTSALLHAIATNTLENKRGKKRLYISEKKGEKKALTHMQQPE